MFLIKLANIPIQINNKYAYVKQQCTEYRTKETPVLIIEATHNEILNEQNGQNYELDYCESLAIYRKICQTLIHRKVFLFHGALIDYQNKGILFTGKSGSGKSTQANLWKDLYRNEVRIINGDKPLISYSNGCFAGFGTPWMGKENLGVNDSVKIEAIVTIKQDHVNEIRKLNTSESLDVLMSQVLFPNKENGNEMLIYLIKRIINIIPIYELKCQISENAVILAKNKIVKEEETNEN
ncbi:hypothetical protein [Enterococcus innesii]